MLVLTGNNLGERQRDLNTKVKEAASNNVDFEQVKLTTENSDVDKLFKIDLASKYMNIEYIIDVLKSGDSLYISRALKCAWMYDDDYSKIINVDYLHTNVIPFMSIKMKKKLLTAISIHVRNEDRAAAFYKYCMDMKLTNIALKFINFTNDNFKLQILKDRSNNNHLLSVLDGENLKRFIGLSFTLADAYVSIFSGCSRLQAIPLLAYLYSVSEVKYLDLLEKYTEITTYNSFYTPNNYLGKRLSRSIMKKHKDRVLKNPALYVPLLNRQVLIRYSNVDDVKIYLIALLPDESDNFWSTRYCETYKFLIIKISNEKFEFLKSIFATKYPDEEFEMTNSFYDQQCYEYMTAEQRNEWALKHIASAKEMFGIGKDYIWFKFVNFDIAFEEIKKLIMITQDTNKRAEMVNVLIESAKNQRDVEKLLLYYYDRHINELPYIKQNFIDKLLQYFNVYEFDENCWTALNKIFYSLDVYSMTENYNCKSEYKLISLIYNIINKKEVHEAVKLYIRTTMYFYSLKINTDRLPKEQEEMVFHYLFEFYMDEIRKHENIPYNDDVKHHLRKYIHFILDLLDQYNRTKHDLPELVMHFMKLDWPEFNFHRLIHENSDVEPQLNLMHDLKKDANLVVDHLPLLKSNIANYYTTYNISQVLRKLRVYFSNDVAKELLKFFVGLLEEKELLRKTAQSAVHGIFQLGDENYNVELMRKYAPTEAKINHTDIDENLLRIQEAICAHACYSRPPVPLNIILMYIKGDYVHFCLPIFQSYLANLPPPLCLEFVEAILNTPVSIQKHGIRLAFECLNVDTLNKLILHIWKKTKNVSLRMIIFKAIMNKISEDIEAQAVLFDTLKTITLSLHQDDDDEVFKLLTNNTMPRNLMRQYIEVAWKVVSQLPSTLGNMNRTYNIIQYMSNNIDNVNPYLVQEIIDTFMVSTLSSEVSNKDLSYEAKNLIAAKWDLVSSFITNTESKDEPVKMNLVSLILRKFAGPVHMGIKDNRYVSREMCLNFLRNLEINTYNRYFTTYESINVIMTHVLKTLQEAIPVEEIYLEVWQLKLGILARKVIADAKSIPRDADISDSELKAIGINFATGIERIVKDFVKSGTYFGSFSHDIGSIIDQSINNVKNGLNLHRKGKDLRIAVGLELMKFEMFEIYLLVLNFIPGTVSPCDEEDLKTIMSKIRQFDNKELRCIIFKNIVNHDFEVKNYLEL